MHNFRCLDSDGDGRLNTRDFDIFTSAGNLSDANLDALGFSGRDGVIEDLAMHFYSNVLLADLSLDAAAEGEQGHVDRAAVL